jgi:hypothetical protein
MGRDDAVEVPAKDREHNTKAAQDIPWRMMKMAWRRDHGCHRMLYGV